MAAVGFKSEKLRKNIKSLFFFFETCSFFGIWLLAGPAFADC
jgi:hypothetical protein